MTFLAHGTRAASATAPAVQREYAGWARGWGPTLVLIATVTIARVAYLALVCPYTLVEDEAHYWEWSRRIDWSYYSKGPGVAWVIGASTALGRALGRSLSEFWVRLPAPLFGGLLLLGAAGLARSVARDGRAGFLAVVCILLIPAFQVASLLMTIDVPYAACWAMASWAGYAALRRGSGPAWLALGAALGVGFLFKYTILLLIPGIVIYAFLFRADAKVALRWRSWALVGLSIFALATVPVLIWNARHGWPTVGHLLGHLGVAGGDTPAPAAGKWRWSPLWVLVFIGSQFAIIGPILVLMAWSWRRARGASRELMYLVWCALPVLVFYLLVSLIAEPEGNWPLAGYISLSALAGWGVLEAQRQWKEVDGRRAPRWWLGTAGTPVRMAWRVSIFFGIAVAIASVRLDLVAVSTPMRLLERGLRSAGLFRSDRPLIPVGRMVGARRVAESAAGVADSVAAETGQAPFVVAQQYGRASQLAFYMPGRPRVYCSSSRSEGRRTQYDMWRDLSLDDPALLGRPAVCVGGHLYQWEHAFESVREHGMLDGEPKKSRLTFVGYGYKGFPR
jgi:4-amino-4-deoxy-L-arabinose transferase-like glycosyltransferase